MGKRQQQPYNPHVAISTDELSVIISSRNKLKMWNDLNEQALTNEPDDIVVKNIQSTAAFITLSGKSLTSQNFELMRAINLFSLTLSKAEMAKGVVNGIENSIVKKAKDILSVFEPESMNLAHAQARSQAAIEKPGKIATGIYSAIKLAWQNPDIVTSKLKQAVSLGIDNAKNQLANNMQTDNASYAIGTSIGAGITSISVNMLGPTRKMDWDNYANVLGSGTVPPPLKPLRDFSDEILITPRKHAFDFPFPKMSYKRDYNDYKYAYDHSFTALIVDESALRYSVLATGNKIDFGSGSEMFLSAVKTFHLNGVEIDKILAQWDNSAKYGTNFDQFSDALRKGASLEQAAKQTFTGKMAAKLGLTSVNTSKLKKEVEEISNTLQPIFQHPDWGAGKQMNDYAHKFALAHGRPSLELIPRADAIKPAPSMNIGLLSTVSSLPEDAQETVLKRIKANLATTDLNSNPIKDIEP